MQDNKYSYSTQPHAAPMKRKTKYRDDSDISDSGMQNLMHDPRVVRGNTYAAKVMSSSLKSEPVTRKPISTRNEPARRKFVSKRVSTPPPVEGRMHMDMQTDDFLEELTDKPIELDAETQTQAFMARPASPLFVRAKTGQDMFTQIMPGDLFDFDLEVEPILEVLVGKTLHVAMLELMQEEELEAIRLQQEEFELVRKIELAEVQRLEAEARRKAQEKERRVEQEKKRVADKRDLEEKIAARSFAQQYLGSLHTGVFDLLEEQGFFYDPLQKEVEDVFLVDVMAGLRNRSDCYEAVQQLLDELLDGARAKARQFEADAMRMRQEAEVRRLREEAEALERQKEEEARKAAELAALEAAGEGGEAAPETEE